MLHVEEWPYEVEQPLGREVADRARRTDFLAATDDAALLASRLQVRVDVRQETVGEVGAADPETIVLRQQRGMRRARQADTVEAGLVGACDGDLTVGQILDALASLLGEDATVLRRDRTAAVRELVADGFLTPACTGPVDPRRYRVAANTHPREPEKKLAKKTGAVNGTGHKLVIVESPAKAKTIAGYLGSGYVVESSIGHVRDLPQSAADIPAKIKGEPWARLGVDVDHDFTPYYVVSRDKRSHMTKLKGLLKDASELFLATDEDREGEAIAWHLLDELKPKVPVRRMVFHEITPQAINAAVDNPRDIDMDLVEAQEARRILDRLYGYEVSPVLWKKVMSGLSAGRVQSVATRLVVDKERDRMAFRTASYWDLEGTFDAGAKHDERMFPAKLHSIDDQRVARGSDFTSLGELKAGANVVHLDRSRAEALVTGLEDTAFEIRSVEAKPYRRQPYAPFRTTTLQQEASRKLGYSASATMSVAQRLYENGFITYMRTDSTTLSETAVSAARAQARELYGAEYVPDKPRTYASKVKNAQEAHEAVRPAGENFRTPAQTGLTGDEFRLYELIWMRTVASQMKDAEGRSVTVRLGGAATSGEDVVFSASGRVITFHGFLKAYVEGRDDPDTESDDRETRLPNVSEGDSVSAASISASGHQTKPPARYTEATLIRELEERLIGRPSTYASIIGTILNRGYVYKKGTALVPAWLAFSVIRLLEEHFTRLVSYEFTAGMEEVLDEIAGGRRDRNAELASFYFGSGDVEGLKQLVTELGEIDARELATFPIAEGIELRVGRYGPYIESSAPARARRRRRGTGPGQRARGPAARRADAREGQGAAGQPGRRGDPPRRGPRVRPGDRGQERPLRALRHRAAARRRAEVAPSRAPARCSSR